MMFFFDIRAKVIGLYQKYDYIIKLILKLILVAVVLTKIKDAVGFRDSISKGSIIFLLSLVSAFLPSSLMTLVIIAYLFLQVLAASSLMALTVLAICLVLYCFFLRFTPKQSAVVVALPVLRSMGFPYLMPLGLGLFSNLLSIVPVCCGVFGYYMVSFIKANTLALEQMVSSEATEPLIMYMEVLDKLIKNPAMYVIMFIYAAVIIVVYFVRRLNMDYSFEISIGVGTGVMLLGYIIGSLKYDLGVSLVSVILCTLVSAVLVYIFMFFYRVLNYAATEHVQFEDDDYYYYVKAVPKVNVGVPKKAVKKIVPRASEQDDEEFEDETMEAMDSVLWNEDGIKKRTSERARVEREEPPVTTQTRATQAARVAQPAQVAPMKSAQSAPMKPAQPAATKSTQSAQAKPAQTVAKPAQSAPMKPVQPTASKPVNGVLFEDEDDEDYL